MQPFEKVPEFLAMADVVVIPQKRNLSTIGQVPAKVFDAIAMAKSIIATNVSDLAEILNGCGWIVEPENPEQLAETIQYVLDHPDKAAEMGTCKPCNSCNKSPHTSFTKLVFNPFKSSSTIIFTTSSV
ncbi:unnamed protein product, partial [marine sediment metagenome]